MPQSCLRWAYEWTLSTEEEIVVSSLCSMEGKRQDNRENLLLVLRQSLMYLKLA